MSVVVAIRLRALGDVVLLTPALRALAAAGHAVHAVTERRFVPLLDGLPWLAGVHGVQRTNGSTLAAIAMLRRLRPAMAVDFFGNTRSALLARASGAPVVWGFDLRGRRHFYTHTVPRELKFGRDGREVATAVHLRLAGAAGARPDGRGPEIALGAPAQAAADRLLAAAGVRESARTVGLVAAGSAQVRALPVASSAVIARALAGHGHEVLVLAGPGEEDLTQRLVALAPQARVLPPCGVAELAAVVGRLRAVVGTNSGPQHLAAAQGVPSFSFFGPLHPDTWSPAGAMHGFWRTELPCRACDRTTCPHWNCMPSLDPGRAAALAVDHLDRHPRHG